MSLWYNTHVNYRAIKFISFTCKVLKIIRFCFKKVRLWVTKLNTQTIKYKNTQLLG